MKRFLPLFASFVLLLSACKTQQAPSNQTTQKESTDAKGNQPGPAEPADFPYRPSETKAFDLIHTRLEVDFVWEKEQMNGKAILTMRPWFEAQNEVTLNAKGFIINKVGLVNNKGEIQTLKYDYKDNLSLKISLDRSYTRSETLNVYIDYVARPSELKDLVSKDEADDQGLYFINPRKEEAGKPQQIWTQGESHGSPAWFPTFDTPNQKCTQEIFITVADSFQTLSNGLLVSSQKNADGTRTDDWKMSLPHSPYLFMMAIGRYSIIKDTWRGKTVDYYVEPEYAQYAKLIFGKTPEMLEFFSNKLGVEYPWEKYSQVVVRDFVSGAMENTSATTHFGGLQHDARQHIDRDHEDIISHELFHQWFGDLVTCESWPNLTLNEGFATYGEYLWIEHKYGSDEAQMHLLNNRESYLREARRKREPLIRYHVEGANAMFDAHSYQKGGQVLQMLRKEVGEEAFFASLKLYLEKNAYKEVEVHQLRMAFEEITGRDLSIFFNQWYLAAGHPELNLTETYADGKFTLKIEQVQDLSKYPLYQLPLEIEIVTKGKSRIEKVLMDQQDLSFSFFADEAPDFVFVDPNGVLLLEIKSNNRDQASWKKQLALRQDYQHSSIAFDNIDFSSFTSADFEILKAMSKATFWGERLLAANALPQLPQNLFSEAIELASTMMTDKKSTVRASAVNFFGTSVEAIEKEVTPAQKQKVIAGLEKSTQDSSYYVSSNGLRALQALDQTKALAIATELRKAHNPIQAPSIAKVYMSANDAETIPYIASWVNDPTVEMGTKSGLLRGFGKFLNGRSDAEKNDGRALLQSVVSQDVPWWLRFSAIQSMTEIENDPATKTFLEAYVDKEDNEYVKGLIKRYLKE